MQISCIITWKSRFSCDAPKRCKFVAFLSGKACFLMTRQKEANLLHYYVEKEVFSWRAEKVQICCIFKWKSRFSREAPKRYKFVVFLSGKAGFLVTRQKVQIWCIFLVEKQVFSWHAKKVQICGIFKWKSRFSRDAIKRCKFDAFLSGKAGFLVTRQNLILMHYYEKRQVFLWRAKNM